MYKKKKFFLSFLFLLIFLIQSPQCQIQSYKIRTISFYNVENLFDTINDPDTFDDDFTRIGKNHYTSEIYWKKIENISRVLSQIGADKTNTSPAIIGLAEIENRSVLEDLVNSKNLRNSRYKILHFDSQDRRGIDVAFLYREKYFTPLHHESYEVRIWDEFGNRIYTRDQLVVSGLLGNDLMHFIIVHWPSRRGGRIKSSPKREKAAYITKQIIDKIKSDHSDAKIFILGDFNDDPIDKSVKDGLNSIGKINKINKDQMFNPMEEMFKKGLNTLGYRDGINLFDQTIMTPACISKNKNYSSYCFYKAGIYNPSYLITEIGRYKGYPFRSFQYNMYKDGYSDHFPVYFYLIKQN